MPKGSYIRPVTRKQMETLICCTPAPIGMGLTISETAMLLGVTRQSIFQRLRAVRKWRPEAYENYKSICRAASRHRIGLKYPLSNTCENFEEEWIVQKF